MAKKQSMIAIVASLITGFLVILACSSNSVNASGVRLFTLCGVLAFLIQWICFTPAWFFHSERFFDLIGSATYLTITIVALIAVPEVDTRSVVLGIMVCLWGLRLGAFLFARVQAAGHDVRFNLMKHDFTWFLMTWTIQGLWVVITSSAALTAITSTNKNSFGWIGIIGIIIWLSGFVIEIVADEQKRRFKLNPSNQHSFIDKGLWSWSQHPNYFGEIILWIGVTLVALPALSGWQYLSLISPVFVFFLLTRISGIPMLDSAARKRWGDNPDFQKYKETTPVLILKRP
jgi:steroid 5-alpha reductase family enzyme|tara:strand:- start:6308 stop:7171 length:864 start_codon:yes stop_codon:yes gene_type:complete